MSMKAQWDKLNPSRKKAVSVGVVVLLVLVITVFGYRNRGSQNTGQPAAKGEQVKSFGLVDQKYLDKNVYDNTKKIIDDTNQKVLQQEKELKDMKDLIQRSQQREEEMRNTLKAQMEKAPPPPPPSGNGRPGFSLGFGQPSQQAAPQPAVELVGDIAVRSNTSPAVKDPKDAKADAKKKAGEAIYLPPSFMQANLLSGLLAPATGNGKSNPVPVLIRIKDLAVLPNEVKANLKGCFVIAEGVGNLATERAELRLISLSCLSRKGQALIDQKIKGFVVDEDGITGLHGKVVSKMGATIARAALAGFIDGFGEALKSEGSVTTVTGAGVVQTVDASELTKKGIGAGLSAASKELQKFYLDLAKQTLPVIEVLPQKSVTLVVSEGIELAIKNLCGGEPCKE